MVGEEKRWLEMRTRNNFPRKKKLVTEITFGDACRRHSTKNRIVRFKQSHLHARNQILTQASCQKKSKDESRPQAKKSGSIESPSSIVKQLGLELWI